MKLILTIRSNRVIFSLIQMDLIVSPMNPVREPDLFPYSYTP